MSPGVRLRDGVQIELSDGQTVTLDGGSSSQPPVLSHAHGDHLVDDVEQVIAANLTAALAGVRRSGPAPRPVRHSAIDLHPAGHIAGSRAAKVVDPATGRSYLYTGDCCTRDRFYLDGFDPPDADVLIIEATYGDPSYTFPPTETVLREIHAWLADTMDSVVILFGYALGRAQKLQRILADSCRDRVFVTDAIADLNAVIEDHRTVSFPATTYDDQVELSAGDALVLPMQTSRLAWIESLIDAHDAVTAGFSGWAADQSFVYRRGLDEGFVLSDHCDFEELLEVVHAVDPERVYTHHGFAEQFARYLTSTEGYEAQALKQNQSTLGEF